MANENIQVIRVEISENGVVGPAKKDTASISPGTLVATADVKSGISKYGETLTKMAEQYKKKYDPLKPIQDREQVMSDSTKLMKAYLADGTISEKKQVTIQDGIQAVETENRKKVFKSSTKVVSAAVAAYGLYSQHQSIGLSLSGASHAAERQQRSASVASFATGIGISLATGQYWATALMLAGRAWQLAQTNRQELFSMKKSQIVSSIEQKRLVTNTVQRRF